ncbi:hypothetical protein PFISCL1PPCAC_3404, partial [Pristionchus fissidentatus]
TLNPGIKLSQPPNPLDLDDGGEDENNEVELNATETSTGTADEPTSAVPWVPETTEEKIEEVENVVEADEDDEIVEATLAIPDEDAEEMTEEPMRGDYPDDYYRRAERKHQVVITVSNSPERSFGTKRSRVELRSKPYKCAFQTTTDAAPTTVMATPTTTVTPSSVTVTASPSATPSPSSPSPMTSSTTALPPRKPALPLNEFGRAAITATNEICADIARNILMSGGNAVDAAVAGAFCLGGVEPHAAGLGGSVMMTVYQKITGRCEVINGRESAPMRVDTALWERHPGAYSNGYESIAIPGALHALLSAYRRFRSSRIEWAELIQPTIQLVESGFPVSKSLADAVKYRVDQINTTSSMRDIFLPDGSPIKEGDAMKDARLAETLRKIATSRDPGHLFYRGEMAEKIVHEIKAKGGHIAKSDLVLFASSVEEALHVPVSAAAGAAPAASQLLQLCGPMPPSSFAALQAGLRIVEDEDLFAHYLIEATKKASDLEEYLGDSSSKEALVNLTSTAVITALTAEITAQGNDRKPRPMAIGDTSTAHINVIDEFGSAVALTMSLNRPFGAMIRSEALGFVWNDALAYFAPSKDHPNFMQPKKRPMTNAMPFVILNQPQVQLVGGTTGSALSLSSMLATLARLIFRENPLDEAVAAPRIDAVSGAFEAGALVRVRGLEARGHTLVPQFGDAPGAATHLLRQTRGTAGRALAAVCDPRAGVARCARGI